MQEEQKNSQDSEFMLEPVPENKRRSTREFDTLKFKKAPQSLETGLFFCQLFCFSI